MNRREFLLLFEELTESEPHSLSGSESLLDLERWDSLVMLGLIALVDEKLEMSLPPKRIAECRTVDDVIGLLGGKIVGAGSLAA